MIFLKNKNKHAGAVSGFTLIETLVAISIFSLSILGLMSVLSQGIADINYAKQRMTAEYLAQEGIEYTRNVRDNYVLYDADGGQAGWDKFSALTCTFDSPCGFNDAEYPGFVCASSGQTCKLYLRNGHYDANSGSGTDSGFVRTIWLVPINANEREVFSRVSWTQGSGSKQVTFSSTLFNWIQ
jgi:prepilin-type N-terminal cleavage/methylation domain-containing protein